MKTRVLAGVTCAWLLVALVWASQTVLGGSIQGEAVAMRTALRTSLLQTLPWIPVTLVIVALATRFPVTRERLGRVLWPHAAAFVVLLYLQNILVVLGFWIASGRFAGMTALLRSSARWWVMRVHVGGLVYIAIAGTTQALLYYRRTRARELQLARVENQLTQARLDALVAQIRPHFLFNTLHTIGHLWRSGRHTEADVMLDNLGDLFHRVQRSTSQRLIPLHEELETVRAYLDIEKARYRDRMCVELRISPDARDCAVPPLLLQPLVENAVRHGVALSSSVTQVVVCAERSGHNLILEVKDEGPGMQTHAPSPGTGTGLATTRARLEQLFPDEHDFQLSSDTGGTRVRISIPARIPGEIHVYADDD